MSDRSSRFIALACLLILSQFVATAAHARACLSDLQRSSATVSRVIDGDTVVLANGQKVRIIGINTLELDAKDPQDKRLAKQAHTTLQRLLRQERVTLFAGRDRKDRYDRLLAHIKIGSGQDVATELLAQGLAISVSVGRNSACAEENMIIEKAARERNLGVWSEKGEWWSDQQPRLTRFRGFSVIRATVSSAKLKGRKSTLQLANGLRVKLGGAWPMNAQDTQTLFSSLKLHTIEVRGWLGGKVTSPTLTLHHTANMQVASP